MHLKDITNKDLGIEHQCAYKEVEKILKKWKICPMKSVNLKNCLEQLRRQKNLS